MTACPKCDKEAGEGDRFCSGCGAALVAEGPSDVLDDLIRDYQRELSDKPDDANILYNLGLTFERKGRFADALAALRRVREVAPEFSDVEKVISRIDRRSRS